MTAAMHRILVVEDDAGIRALLRTLLEAAHYRVSEAENGARALVEVRAGRPDLVIVDLETCEVEAFQVLKELRESADLKGVPVVGVVTQAKSMLKPEAEKAGCLRVYLKTEFGRVLPDLIARYAV